MSSNNFIRDYYLKLIRLERAVVSLCELVCEHDVPSIKIVRCSECLDNEESGFSVLIGSGSWSQIDISNKSMLKFNIILIVSPRIYRP